MIAEVWGLTGPWWFAFVGAALTLLFVWKPISQIVSAAPVSEPMPDESQASKEP
ncbi:hypothetical protein [Microbacterium saperdae]|uniref:hypothetical protein n=1 Tax=Microbacterium saperdae TaxID=69368 RepID=UPI00166A4642|nr:hypothetical protein [Microbacterium saperdae]GGM55548.1 hypothetical protein GCM10010489_28940 [Microbacterium saperdae]